MQNLWIKLSPYLLPNPKCICANTCKEIYHFSWRLWLLLKSFLGLCCSSLSLVDPFCKCKLMVRVPEHKQAEVRKRLKIQNSKFIFRREIKHTLLTCNSTMKKYHVKSAKKAENKTCKKYRIYIHLQFLYTGCYFSNKYLKLTLCSARLNLKVLRG